ncbi:hypothetical protein AAFC00_005922 [Neodothiora populina]|uniref:tRNA-dihydrouridine synthase n=1 Tax=Neodothiora populina TaxID=2781224 RepID=A0ABR3P6A8_9PEZI
MAIEEAHAIRRINPLSLFDVANSEKRPLYVAAPMVRYSKLPFRLLVRDYGVDITYTPMILAHEFIRHPVARASDFSTSPSEGVVIAQFASNDPTEFGRAAEMISPWVNGVDLNCGCPQSWASKEGLGCSLMASREKVAAMVKEAKRRLSGTGKTVSVKIRVHKDVEETKRFVACVEEAGVDFITVHGRTRNQRSSTPPDYDAIKVVRDSTKLPMLANGDVYSLADAHEITRRTGADGVMAARGLLVNPTLFAGHERTPREAVATFMDYASASGLRIELVIHHLSEMMAGFSTRKERMKLTQCNDMVDLTDLLEDHWQIVPIAAASA